jgi:hypothetical protein
MSTVSLLPSGPDRVFASAARCQVFPPVVVLSWNWSLVQSTAPATYRPRWFCEPTSPLAAAPVLWVFVTNAVGGCFRSPESNLSASSTFLQSIGRPTLAAPPQRDDTSHELSRPSAHSDRRVHYDRALPARRFRLQGLATLLTVSSSATLADLVSDRQRSWDSPFGAFSSRRVPRHSCRADPHAVSLSRVRPPEGERQQERHRLLGFAPATSPSWLDQAVKPGRHRRLLWASPF